MVQADFLGLLLAIGLFLAIVALVYSFVVVMIAYPLLRYIVGGGLIWLIWASTTEADIGLAWFGTAVVGLMMLSPWLVIIGIISFVIGFLAVRR